MRVNICVKIVGAIFFALLSTFSCCQADELSDLDLILTIAKPGQQFTTHPSFLKSTKQLGNATLYEGKLNDINIFIWVENGIVDSAFLTVKGKQYNSWCQLLSKHLDKPSIDQANGNGRILRYYDTTYEYYLVFYNKQGVKGDLTDFSLFLRGPGHELNERYHENGDIWLGIFTQQQ